MDLLKGWAKNIYDKVVEDDYLEPISQTELYLVIQRSNRKLSAQYSDGRRMSMADIEGEWLERIELMGNVSPEREFRVLGRDPRFEIVASRIKELKEDLEEVNEIMSLSFPKYKMILNTSIKEIDDKTNL